MSLTPWYDFFSSQPFITMIIILRLSMSTDSPEIEEGLETDTPRAHGDSRAGARDTDVL